MLNLVCLSIHITYIFFLDKLKEMILYDILHKGKKTVRKKRKEISDEEKIESQKQRTFIEKQTKVQKA